MVDAGVGDSVHFKDSPGYAGDRTLHLNAALIVCTTLVVGLRLYIRAFMSKALGADDLLAFLAFVGSFCFTPIPPKSPNLIWKLTGSHYFTLCYGY